MTKQYLPEYRARGLTPLVVLLDPPLDACFDRIYQRSGKDRSQLRDEANVSRRVATARNLAQWCAEQLGEAAVLTLSDGAAPDANASRVVRWVYARRLTIM